MKRSSDYRIRLVLVGIVAAIVFGGGHAQADFTFGEPVNLRPTVNTSYAEVGQSISADGIEFFVLVDRERWATCALSGRTKTICFRPQENSDSLQLTCLYL